MCLQKKEEVEEGHRFGVNQHANAGSANVSAEKGSEGEEGHGFGVDQHVDGSNTEVQMCMKMVRRVRQGMDLVIIRILIGEIE